MSSLLFSISLVVISTSVAKAGTTIVVYYRLTEEVETKTQVQWIDDDDDSSRIILEHRVKCLTSYAKYCMQLAIKFDERPQYDNCNYFSLVTVWE